MQVSVVIPNWNGRDKLAKNLPEVIKLKGVDEIIVADDASSDDSVAFLKQTYPQIKLVENKVNQGFAGNVNTGVAVASADLIFLLNTDAAPKIDCLDFALPHFEDPQVFSVGCNVGGSWNWAKWQDGYFWHNQAKETLSEAHQTLWASGGSGLFRRSIWNQMGGLDELFNPFYEEDLDLGYRATKRGYINMFEPKAMVEHYQQKGVIEENFTKTKVAQTAERNILIFTWKNIHDSSLMRQHIWALIKMVILHPGYIRIVTAALLKLTAILKKRAIEKAAAKISDQALLDLYSI